MTGGLGEQKKAVSSGHWLLYRYNPALAAEGKNPLQLDSKEPTTSFADYAYGENRYMVLKKSQPEHAADLMKDAEKDVKRQQTTYRNLAALDWSNNGEES